MKLTFPMDSKFGAYGHEFRVGSGEIQRESGVASVAPQQRIFPLPGDSWFPFSLGEGGQ